MSILLELTVYAVVTLFAIRLIIRWMATGDVCFTFGKTNHVKVVESGGKTDENGFWVDGIFEDAIIVDDDLVLCQDWTIRLRSSYDRTLHGPERTPPFLNVLLRKYVGCYWYGLYPFYHIKNFYVRKEKENVRGTNPETWIIGSNDRPVLVSALRIRFPRPFVFTDVELADRLKIHQKVVAKILVTNFRTTLYHYTNDFLDQSASILQGWVIDTMITQGKTIDDFLQLPKGNDAGILRGMQAPDSPLNVELEKQVGLIMTSLAINDWEPGDKEIVAAIQLRGLNEKRGEAQLAAAKFAAQSAIEQAKGESEANRLRSEGQLALDRAVTAAVTLPGSDPTTATVAAATVLGRRALAETDITTFVEGGSNAGVVVSTTPKKEKTT